MTGPQEMYGPAVATEQDVTFAWRGTEAAAETLGALPEDAEAWAAARSAFATFVAASRSAERAGSEPRAESPAYGPPEATLDDVDLARIGAIGAGFIHGADSPQADDAETVLEQVEDAYMRHQARTAEKDAAPEAPERPSLYDEAETGIEAGS